MTHSLPGAALRNTLEKERRSWQSRSSMMQLMENVEILAKLALTPKEREEGQRKNAGDAGLYG